MQPAGIRVNNYYLFHLLSVLPPMYPGRRTQGGEAPNYKKTMSPDAPVLIEGGWTQPGMGEVRKSLQVHQLEVKTHTKMIIALIIY